jgi:hypothetical protein
VPYSGNNEGPPKLKAALCRRDKIIEAFTVTVAVYGMALQPDKQRDILRILGFDLSDHPICELLQRITHSSFLPLLVVKQRPFRFHCHYIV